jgi:excisionase family DNA binding protein
MALLTSKEVAALLRVHPKQVYRLLKQGLPAARVGDEWRFERDAVLRWANQGAPAVTEAAPSVPPLLAANGDVVVELLLRAQTTDSPRVGFVLSDHGGAARLLDEQRVLLAGVHEDVDSHTLRSEKVAVMHLAAREIGIAAQGRALRTLGQLAGKRVAMRPRTAGIQLRLDRELGEAGDSTRAFRASSVHASHRDVVLAVVRGEADFGLTTHAWAAQAGLKFTPIGAEDYGISVLSRCLGHPSVVSLFEIAQDAGFRKQLKAAGYGTTRTGRLTFVS